MFNKTKSSKTQSKATPSIGSSVIGPTLQFIGGQLTSDEDLVIEGTVEGTIAHQSHHLRIGETGRVKADVHARVIIVEGTIEGNMRGDEAVQICSTARVIGDIVSPRVSIADGASFEGLIKTSPESVAAASRDEKKRGAQLTDFAGSIGVRARKQERPNEPAESSRNDEGQQVTR